MSTTIDSLVLETKSNAQSAVSGIDALSASLGRLKSAVKGGVGLTSVTNQLKNLNTALGGVDASSAGKLDALASSLQKLHGLGSIKISSSIATQLTSIGTAVRSLSKVNFSPISNLVSAIQPLSTISSPNLNSTISQLNKLPGVIGSLNGVDMAGAAQKVRELVSALAPLTSIGKANIGSFFSQINKLPQMVTTLNSVDMPQLAAKIQELSAALEPLANRLNAIARIFTLFPGWLRRLIRSTDDLSGSNDRAANSYMNLWARCRMAMNVVRSAARSIASWITESNSYIENLNLFTASMGKYAGEAQKYAEQVGELMGIDPGEWMRNQGVFMTITEGFGVASDRAYIMSKNLTQLGYDLSSFFNISFADAMQKLQSGISGELEPLRRLGYDLSQTRLQQEAWSLGIDKSITKMTQAEKSQLRYHAIMTQVTKAQGDMARTLNAPANQLRVLQAQVTQCARALGNVFIPALNAVLPYAIALMKVLRSVADSIALFFGFSLPEVDYSGLGEVEDTVGGIGEELEDATDTAKKLKNALIGIDELNIISPKDSDGDGGDGPGLGDLGFDLPEYDFLGDLIADRADKIQKWMEKILPLVAEIGAGLAAWAIADSLIPDLGLLENLLGGLMLAVGLTLLIDSIKDIIINGELTWGNILEGAAGGALAGAGLGLMLAKQLGLSWKNGMLLGAVIGVGLSLAIMSIVAEIVDGLDFGKILLGAIGGAIAGAGVGAGIMLKAGGSVAHGAALGAVIGVGVVLSIMGIIAEIKDGVNFGNCLLTAIGGALIGAGLGYWLGGPAGAVIGITIGVGVSLLITGIISEVKDGVNAGNGILTAIGGALTGAGIGFAIGGPAGAAIGAVVGVGVSLVITGLISQVKGGVDIGGALMTIIGSALAGAGIGFVIGGPAGAAVGAAIGVVVGIGLELIGIAAAGKEAYEASEDFKVMENIIDRSAETANRCADALKNMQTNISNLNGVTSDFAAASQLVSEIFDINENAHASNYELELMRVKVDVLNGMNIKGLSLSIDETTGRVKESRQEVEKLIESLQKEAQMEAMKELLVETYKDLARAQADSVQALKDYDSAASKLAETSNELANCPWYDLARKSELTAAQKEQTEAVNAAQKAYADSRNVIDELTGTIDLYSGQIVDMKLAEVGVGDELVSGLGNVQYSLEETAASMTGYGENIAEGLRQGVDKNTKEKEYKSIWQRIGDWFKNLFGIHSPSTVFASYGEYLILGLLNGMASIIDNIGNWIKENILTPIANAFKNNPAVEFAVKVKNTAKEWWGNVKSWWSGISKEGISVEAAVSLVKKGWTTVKAWIGGLPNLSQVIELAKNGWKTVEDWIGKIPVVKQGIELAKSSWTTVTKWIGEIPTLSQTIQLVKKGWSTVRDWVGHIPTLDQAIRLIKSGWTTVKNWIGNIPILDQAIKLIKSGWSTVRDWIGTIPILDQGIKLIKSGWTTVKNFVGYIPTLDQAIQLVKSGWTTVRTWIGNIPTLDQAIQLVKSGWTTVKNWVGYIPTLDQAIQLIKSGWSTVSNWIGNIPVLSQAISLAKSGWSTVASWIGRIPALEQAISLAKSGWTSIAGFVGTSVSVGVSLFKQGWNSLSRWVGNKISVGVELFKSGWNSIKSFFGLSTGGYNTGHGWKFFEKGGYIDNGQAQFWKNIPMYKNGTTNAGLHGSMFVAGENGAEMVGHINGQTEVLNRSQISMAMENAVVKGMAQYTGYWRSLNSQMTVCANGVIRSILVSSDVLSANLVNASSYDPTNALAQMVYEDSQRAYDKAASGDMMGRSMRDFYREYVEPTLKEIAADTKRQADKEETTVVQIGNRTITEAVDTQKKANGYVFAK